MVPRAGVEPARPFSGSGGFYGRSVYHFHHRGASHRVRVARQRNPDVAAEQRPIEQEQRNH